MPGRMLRQPGRAGQQKGRFPTANLEDTEREQEAPAEVEAIMLIALPHCRCPRCGKTREEGRQSVSSH